MALSLKHMAFVDEYFINGFNAVNAYMTVYKDITYGGASKGADKVLKRIDVINEIAIRQAALAAKNILTREELIQDLRDIKNAQKSAFPPAAIKAIEILLKAQGYNAPDKTEHSGKIDQNINLNIPGVSNTDTDGTD